MLVFILLQMQYCCIYIIDLFEVHFHLLCRKYRTVLATGTTKADGQLIETALQVIIYCDIHRTEYILQELRHTGFV
ncbi:hypothetical protein D3C80_2183320 [compost metagenome]